MATINSRTLFFTTSPRSPEKIRAELELLDRLFSGQTWNRQSQTAFMEALTHEDFYHGNASARPDFSARDRITRSPKAYGLVSLKPKISLTRAGEQFVFGDEPEIVLLRQLLKFQLPSPYHKSSKKNSTSFCVKPFLELLRLIRHLGFLSFDEMMLFGMQLTDYRLFSKIAEKVTLFRKEKAENKGHYGKWLKEYLKKELTAIYYDNIEQGITKTRESADTSVSRFLSTKARNMRDYTDACVRYLRYTGVVSFSFEDRKLSISKDYAEDVDYILEHTTQEPGIFSSEQEYIKYLGASDNVILLCDNRELLIGKLERLFPQQEIGKGLSAAELRKILKQKIYEKREFLLQQQTLALKHFEQYEEVQSLFSSIISDRGLYQAPLLLEWNVWRAMTMINGGNIRADLRFDDNGTPLSTAPGNMADIICDYGDFLVAVEVTMLKGHRQFEQEGEPITRHLGHLTNESGKPCYCLFIAPKINQSVPPFFYALNHSNIAYYGGRAKITPLPLRSFMQMVENADKASERPQPKDIKWFLDNAHEAALTSADELQWQAKLSDITSNWPFANHHKQQQ